MVMVTEHGSAAPGTMCTRHSAELDHSIMVSLSQRGVFSSSFNRRGNKDTDVKKLA